ncbi:hypothetical protein BCR36DRAFT_408277 [Piromyces finnis]|uniref:Protein kinase domain-containing protein n=1 Tax=Piromyces finnis TaxID=1754191 RepID=A0A1Y1VLU4_9FUNG|nr:hypothetical protein BCR36DRAFT_408277 [Piromyces finnis]|eukprot:ORX59905.1 hypothetical protein BCR36DRAFT_408277 [Piromyces finnis]
MNEIVRLLTSMKVDENGLISDRNFVKDIIRKVGGDKNLKSSLKNSYLPYTSWYIVNIQDIQENNNNVKEDEDYEIVLIRISTINEAFDEYEKLIQNEYILNKKLLDYGVSPKFKGYSFFGKCMCVSIFFTYCHNTLAEYMEKNDFKNILKELVHKLYLIHHQENGNYCILPTLSPYNILCSKNNLCPIIFSEIFLSNDSVSLMNKLKKPQKHNWFVPEFNQLGESEQYQLSYYSSIHSFGYILYYLLTGKAPLTSDEEWKIFFEERSDNIEHILFRDIIKECISVSEENKVLFSSLYKKINTACEKSSYNPFTNDSLKLVPFYVYNGMKSVVFGVRSRLNINNDIKLLEPKASKIKKTNRYRYKVILTNVSPDMYIKIYKPIYKDVLTYLRQISLINPKNYEYPYQYISELTEMLSNYDLVDIILKTGFNPFAKVIINILRSRNYSLKDISKYIDNNYKVNSNKYKNAPELIYELNKEIDLDNNQENNNIDEKVIIDKKRNELLCDEKFYSNENKTDQKKDIVTDVMEMMPNILNSEYFDYIDKNFCQKKIEEYNNSPEGQKRRITTILTPETIKKIKQIIFGLLANTPMIIKGFTSAGKSFNAIVSSVIHGGQSPVSIVLSENTTVEDLLGKYILQRKESSMMSFVPGVLLKAYIEGKILILDECDLAKPEVLSCILGSLSKDEITVNNRIYRKTKGYNVILTMNGETEGFTSTQRNELNLNILSKFVIIEFDKMSKEECELIFMKLMPNAYKQNVPNFVNLHNRMLEYSQKTIDPIVTLRNLKACIYLLKVNIPVRASAEIAYSGRFPIDERNEFNDILGNFGSDDIDSNIKKEIIKRFDEYNLYYNDSYLKCAYLALSACKAGLHPLLIGKNGSGLTELAKFVACNYSISTDTFLSESKRTNVEVVCLGSETSTDDLVGCFQPILCKTEDLTKLISWVDGPIFRAGKSGNPVILDGINCAKSQVIEYLNPLLEDNSVFNNVKFNVKEKGDEEYVNIEKGFIIIGTMKVEEGIEKISKALMNRFVAIYLDDFSLNAEVIEKITYLTVKKLENKNKKSFEVDDTLTNNCDYNKIENESLLEMEDERIERDEEEDEITSESDFDEEEDGQGIVFSDSNEEESENDKEGEFNNLSHFTNERNNANISSEYSNDNCETKEEDIPNWYNMNNFNSINIKEIVELLKNVEFKNIKTLIKTITKLYYIIQRTKMSGSDSYTFLKLTDDIFDLKNIDKLISDVLNDNEKGSNIFFFNNNKIGNAKKMILSLILSDLSCSPIFIQGTAGTGKSVAVRHYGSFRKFRNRDPILTISCSSEMTFEQFIGTYSFRNTSFQFIEGPLLTAMRNGEPILVDEFNLCSEEVLLSLLPLLKAEINDSIQLKGVPYKVKINQGFVFIATGNNDNESGRKKLPNSILDELINVKISNPSLEEYKGLIDEIINNEYKECSRYISSDNICDIVEVVESVAQQSFTLRHIKILLNRIKRFCTEELTCLEISNEEYRKIPVAYVIISFIIPSLKVGKERIEQLVEKIGIITNIDSKELLEFIKSEAIIVSRQSRYYLKKNYIKKGKIILSTSLKKNYPPIILQTYFWIRMSCSLNFDSPSEETLLLVGETSYKSYILEQWLDSLESDSYEEHFVTGNTETQDLIGISTLENKDKLSNYIDSLVEKAILYLHGDRKNINGAREEKLRSIMNELEIDEKGIIHNNKNNVCLEFIYRCIKELINLEENYDKSMGIKTVTSFNLGIISSACIFGKKLIIKGINQISSSVLERINSVLEYPRSLVLNEDTQGIFNNQKIFKDLYKSNRRSIPISNKFTLCFTSREIINGKLSEAFKSRCSTIICPSYDNSLYLGIIQIDKYENYSLIAKSIITKNELQKEIIKLYNKITNNKIIIPVLSFIRWCNTTERISEYLQDTSFKEIVGIAVLRSIFDGFEPNNRTRIIRELLLEYLPENLYNLIVNDENNDDYKPPFEIENKDEDFKYVKSIYSGIKLQVTNPKIDKLNEIKWTKSASDMADSILTSLVAHTMLIFEGPPGRGKTAIATIIYEFLDIDYRRINLSPSTTEEDIFSRTVPKITNDSNEKNIKTEIQLGPLLQIVQKSSNSIKYCKNALLLDEINLASNELLTQLYSFLISIFYKKEYHTSYGKNYKIGKIGVIATMNDAKLSNARTALSSNILNLSHTFKLSNYEQKEMMILANNILGREKLFKKKEFMIRTLNCFLNSQKYIKNNLEIGGFTLREILKIGEFTNKCPDVPLDALLEIVLCSNMSDEDAYKFKEENQFTNTLSNITPDIKNNKLRFKDLIEYDLIRFRCDGPLKRQFTSPEKDALMKILIGLKAMRTILLSGDIGTGKTYIVETLAEIIGVKLNIIQFNAETSSSDTIGKTEMSVDSNEEYDIKKELNKLKKILIKEKWPRITSFICMDFYNSKDIKKFFGKLCKENPISNEAKDQLEIYCCKLEKYSTLSFTNFEFKKSLLLNAMEKGEWILIDDLNYAPQEIERLMPLLEESPSLTIFEQSPQIKYSRNYIEDTDTIKHIQIHKNFRLFLIASNENALSTAIKSRCLCVRLKPFEKPQHYSELIYSCLSNSNLPENDIISIATHLGRAFHDIKNSEKEIYFLLKNLKLTPVNLVYLSKVLSNYSEVNGKTLFDGIKFCIFSMFKNKNEQISRFKKSLSSEIDFNISTYNTGIMKDKKYILCKIEIKILSYAKLLKNKEISNNDIDKEFNDKLNSLFKKKYKTKRVANIKINNEKENEIIDFIKRAKNDIINNLEQFTLEDIEEYKEYIEEVLFILENFIPEEKEIYDYLYYLKYLNLLLKELTSIKNKKVKGLKLNTIENSKDYFLQFGDSKEEAEENALKVYWFRNVLNGFDIFIPEKVSTKNLNLSIINIYYNHYAEEYNTLPLDYTSKIKIEPYIYLKFLENIKLRKILKYFNFTINDGYIEEIFYTLVHYKKSIEIHTSVNEILEIIMFIGENSKFIIEYNNGYCINKYKIEELRDNLKLNELYSKYKYNVKDIYKKNMDYIIPLSLKKNNNLIGGNIYWFYNIFAKEYDLKSVINNNMLCEFNKAIENILRLKTYNTKNMEGIWNNELKDILNKGYQLIYSLQGLKNILLEEENKEEKIKEFIENIMTLKKYKLFHMCESKNVIIENIINLIDLIKDFFKRYEINIWDEMELFKNTCIIYLESEKLKEKYETEKIKYVNQLNQILLKLNNICNQDNKNKFDSIDKEIRGLLKFINNTDIEDIANKIREIEKQLSMFKIANDDNINKMSSKKSQILNDTNVNNNNNETIKSEVLVKYSKLCNIINRMKKTKEQQLLINNMFMFCDISTLDNFINTYKVSFMKCLDDKSVLEVLIKELKHLVNSLLISDIINIYNEYSQYEDYLTFIKEILSNNLNYIKILGNYFEDDAYIYLPKLDIIDLKYCVQYGIKNKEYGSLIKSITHDLNIKIRNPEEGETTEEYLKYLIYQFDKDIDFSHSIEEIILSLDKKHIETVKNLYNAAKIVELFKSIKYDYNKEWLMKDVDEMKNSYWKEPGKILVKYKYSSLLHFNQFSDKNIFDGEKIIAKSLYAAHEALNLKNIQYKKGILNDILTEVLNNIYNDTINNYNYGYRTILFYNNNIYKDNVGETMVSIIYSAFEILLQIDDIVENYHVKNIIKEIINKFIVNCINYESPDFDNIDITNICNILINNSLSKYNLMYKNKKEEYEEEIITYREKFITIVEKLKEKYENIYETEKSQYLKKLEDYNNKIYNLREKYKKEFTFDKFITNIYTKKNKNYSDCDQDNKEAKKKYTEYMKKNTEDEEILKYYKINISKPFDENIDEKIKSFNKECNSLLLLEIYDINIFEYKTIINSNKITNFIEDDRDKQLYLKYEDNLKEKINDYINIINDNKNFMKEIKNITIPSYRCSEYNIEADVKTLMEWIKKLLNCKINMKINEYKEIPHNKETNITETIKMYSTDTNWINDSKNRPSFLLDNINIDLGIYILKQIHVNNVGSVIFNNTCSYPITFELEQSEKNGIKAYTNGNTIQQNKPLNIKFRLNKNPDTNETIKCEFYIKLIKNNEECDRCKVVAYLNVIPFCIKFKFNEKYNIDENNNLSINHYINDSLEIMYNYPGNYSSNNLGIIIKQNEDNCNNDLTIEQQQGIIRSTFKSKLQQPIVKCSYNKKINLNKLQLINLNLNFPIPTYFGLVVYDEKEINMQSIDVEKDNPITLYLFNMSATSININYHYNNRNIELMEKTENINPGEKKKLIFKVLKESYSENLYLGINNKNIDINVISLPKLTKEKHFILKYKYICCNLITKSIQNKLKCIIIDNQYKIIQKDKVETIKYKYDSLSSCYLLYNNKVCDKVIKEESNYNYNKNVNCSVYGFSNNNLCTNKIYNVDIVLKYESKNNHVFSTNQMKEFSKILKDEKFKNDLQSNDRERIEASINKLIDAELSLNENINENIKNIKIDESEKTSIKNIIVYLMKMSNDYLIDNFIEQLKKWLKEMYNRSILLPYFNVNTELNENIKDFLNKLKYIISFVDIVVNPMILSEDILDYIKSSSNSNIKLISNYRELTNIFNRCFRYGLEKDSETSEIIFYDGKYVKGDVFDAFDKQIKNSKMDNQSYNIDKINNFIKIYRKEIQEIIDKIINNKVSISNLLNILDECIDIIAKCPLILSTIDNNKELFNYCISNSQRIYDFIYKLTKSPINETHFSKRICKTLYAIHNILSQYEFFDLFTTISSHFDSSYIKTYGAIVQCELPFDNTYENDITASKKMNKKCNSYEINSKRRNAHFSKSQFASREYENYKNESFNNTNNVEKPIFVKENKVDHKNKFTRVLSDEEINKLSVPYFNQNIEENKEKDSNDDNILENNISDILQNQCKDIKISMDILEANFGKITPEKFLEMILERTACLNQSLSEIRYSMVKRDGLNKDGSFNYYDECSEASSYIQSIISNSLKSELEFIDNNNILLPYSVVDSYVDIAVDITHMSPIQRIASLVISTGLSISLSSYGIKIRISVFGERNGVWIFSNDFETSIEIQLSRLRDALSSKKRYMSIPGDALLSLKKDWIEKEYENKKTKYTSVLISSLISPQVVNKVVKWDEIISNNIVVFGLKSDFSEEFMKRHKVYEQLLQVPSKNNENITQQFLDPMNVINQNESESELLEILCKSLVRSCRYKLEEDKDNFKETKIIVNNNHNDLNEEISLKYLIESILNNRNDVTFFAQNKEHTTTEVYNLNNSFVQTKTQLPSIYEETQNSILCDNGSIGVLKDAAEKLLKTSFGLAFPPNASSKKVPTASGGTISIPALKKWIASGFTYKEIFLKKAGKTKRKYKITVAIDFSSSIHLSCNYSHAISTTLLLLIAPSILQDNEEISIDVIISTIDGPKIMYISSKANTFESISYIQSIINIIDKEAPKFCTPGNTLNAAYQLQLEKSGINMGRNIFFITDGYVTSRKEVMFANSIISSCENSGIELMTFGVGSYPYGIKQLYPKCCYAPSILNLADALSYLFSLSRNPACDKIIPQVIISSISEELQTKLSEMINQPPDNTELQESIENTLMDYIEWIGNNNTMKLENINNMKIYSRNPEIEPYFDGMFKGFKILVVILYLGGYEYNGKIRDQNITIQQFYSGTGMALKRKGFEYKLVFSYGDAINELTKSEENRCPYIETWVFCSSGDGSLPDIAIDKDNNKIIPFFECITSFNNNGGGLLLFCDNEPYTLEANILLSEYLKFENEYGHNVKPQFSMKGNYNQPDFEKKNITSLEPNDTRKNGRFKSDVMLPSPGKCKDRMSLRTGLIKFNEGITLSYAEFTGDSKTYSPFTPFAYLSDESNERPFILYYDPKMKNPTINQGPIVIHGGFTSAFYDFTFDGTGRLVISIACWLVRYEERFHQQMQEEMRIDMVKNIPSIDIPENKNENFTRWVNSNRNLYSIIILDVSGSMEGFYSPLINMSNSIIKRQMENPENKGTIIFFATTAKAVLTEEYRELTIGDIHKARVGKWTNSYLAFSEAKKYINPTNQYDDKRLLFLTDGKCDCSSLKPLCDDIANAGFSIHILGFGEEKTFINLKPFVRDNNRNKGTFQVYNNFIEVADSAKKTFAAE